LHWTNPAFISENINVVGAALYRHKVNGQDWQDVVGEMWDGGAMILQLLDQRTDNTAPPQQASSCMLE